MKHVVAKPFNTTIRRMLAGTVVAETDDLSPHTFADLKTRGFIKSDAPAAAVERTSQSQPQSEPVAQKVRQPQRGDG